MDFCENFPRVTPFRVIQVTYVYRACFLNLWWLGITGWCHSRSQL